MGNQITKISLNIILFLLIFISLTFAHTDFICLKNKFINSNESVQGTDFETTYKVIDISSVNRYSFTIAIDLLEKNSLEIKQPLTSKISDTIPYYGVWLYGGENRIPILVSVIRVDESEVPKERLITSQNIPPEQGSIIYYFKIVFDLNRDYDFSNDKALYQFYKMPYYNSGPSNQIEIPVNYINESENENVVNLSYNVSLDLKREYNQPMYAVQKEWGTSPILQSITILGSKVIEAPISFGGEVINAWIIDNNLNGVFDNNDIWAVDLNRDNEWDINSRFTVEKFKLDEPVNIGGKSYLVKEINPVNNSVKIAESKIQVKPREIFGVGSEAPTFARLNYLSQKMITSIDLKGQTYVIYYIRNFYDQKYTKELQYVISLFDKYIGLDKISLILTFDESNFDRVIEALPSGDKPYYLIKGSYEEYDRYGRKKDHILNGFQIDENTVYNQKVLIAVDKNGMVKYLNKNASLDSVVELCEILKPGSAKKKKDVESKGFLSLFKKKKKKVIELPQKPQTVLEKTLEWFRNNQKDVAQTFEPGHIVYLVFKPGNVNIISKSINKSDAIKLPDVKDISSIRFPKFSYNREKLYLLLYDPDGKKQHILSISPKNEPKVLISLEGSIRSYDVSGDESEIIYSNQSGNITHLYRQKLGTQDVVQISENEIGGIFPTYSPDSKWVSYVAQKKLRLYNLETGERKILVDDNLMKEFPEWSPDGKWIVYQASAGDEFLYDIYKVEFATGKVVRLTKEMGIDAQPSFSKDGSKIIFMSERDTGTNNQTVYMMNANGTNVERDLTADTGVHYPRLAVN